MPLNRKTAILLLLIILQFGNYANGQGASQAASPLKIFLDCEDCDFSFVRQNIEFISFVRDPKTADVHILSSESHTGSGGRKYFLSFIGMNGLTGNNFDYEYIADQSQTEDEIRKGLLKRIKLGILQYYSIEGMLDKVQIDLEEQESQGASGQIEDSWNNWVFRIDAGSDFNVEESKDQYSFSSELRIQKVTEEWKLRIDADQQIDREDYIDDGEKFVNHQNETEVDANIIRSLSPRWSTGIFGEYSSRTYLNIKNSFGFDGAVEYNFFPWDISNQKVFTLRYQAGVETYSYNEETIYGKLDETLFYESIGLNLELVQPWGTIQSSLSARHYFHDFSKNRFTLDSDISVRLTKKFSVYFQLEAQIVHDQLYLSKDDASWEDVLLERRKWQLVMKLEVSWDFVLHLAQFITM